MKILNYGMAVLAFSALTLTSCDPEPDPILAPVVSTITAEGTSFEDGSTVTKDLNGASSAQDVATDSKITISLDKAVDGTTVNVSNISVSDGSNDVPANVSSTASTIIWTPTADMIRGTAYTLTVSGVKSSDGGALGSTTRTFMTAGRAPVIVPKADQQLAYYNFDGVADDVLGAFNPDNIVGIEFGTDRFGQGNSTASFDGDISIIEIPNADQFMAEDDFTLSFWMKTNSADHLNADGNQAGMFVMGLGAFFGFQMELRTDFNSFAFPVSYASEDETYFFTENIDFRGEGNDNTTGGWQGTTFDANLGDGGVAAIIMDKWVQVIYSYDAALKVTTLYLNGELMRSFDYNLWPDCAEDTPLACPQKATGVAYRGSDPDVEPILALGFIKSIDSQMWANEPWGDYNRTTSNHFKGDLDDIRIFKASLSADEVATLYNSEK